MEISIQRENAAVYLAEQVIGCALSSSADLEEKIRAFLPILDPMMQGGLLTMEKVNVIDYRANSSSLP